ncbi:hypothetical protein [uncultured Brevundimonas sp.]|jgi:hypothetical protein|uniref:hypothetical protein n=1 Tax=uncultured Brevundimonas sp. TaxID=213418 RepID=UPI000FA8FC4D|nr:hypothetical protein [uncultured Brevundimonas sp.]
MFGRFGRRRFEAPAETSASERPDADQSTNDLISLLQTIEAAAAQVYGRHGLPQKPGHYRRPADGGAWQLLGNALTPAEKWTLIGAGADGESWRYAAYESLGAHSDIAAVRQASALLAACQGLRQRLADSAVISPQDLADSIRLGEAWRRLAEDVSYDSLAPLHFLPPDESAPQA